MAWSARLSALANKEVIKTPTLGCWVGPFKAQPHTLRVVNTCSLSTDPGVPGASTMQAKAMLLCFPSKVKAKTLMRALFAPGPVRPD